MALSFSSSSSEATPRRLGIAPAVADLKAGVQPSLERLDPSLRLRIVLGDVDEHPDAPLLFPGLREGLPEEPRCRRAADEREDAPPLRKAPPISTLAVSSLRPPATRAAQA